MHPNPQDIARHWLQQTYHGLVEPAVEGPVAQDGATWLFACRTVAMPGYAQTPMLAASLVVPKDGGMPFHPAADDPWGDAAAYPRTPEAQRAPQARARRLNARGCVVATAARLGAGATATPLPWQPAHEAPGWWELLLRRYFPGAEQARCGTWDEVAGRIEEAGPDTQGVVWVRRAVGGAEASGHLLNVVNDGGNVVFLDGMTGGPGRLDTAGVVELVLARTRPASPRAADDFASARARAEAWLRRMYREPVELVAPDPGDETARGWLFAIDSAAYLRSGDWRDAMVDAAVVVPKGPGQPFLLPNSDPWGHFAAWDRGEPVGPTPEPGPAAWFEPTLRQLGAVLSVSEHRTVTEAVSALAALPPGGRALVWARRLDGRNRPSTGLLLNGFRTPEGAVGLVDSAAESFTSLDGLHEYEVRVIRYR
ncbi:YrhB domain-containing protein [Streptomyces yaizuensis]|uniref:YrhB domain-containing protein n=1 Tax=Streptomyces yaizuensis TaxID=2989713 RepID=A0ABQ5NSF9_9ACTN|nr:YrhB domain-containing protein [Streptomyces sp. YSPA8]GLF93080.1 YrhB domain-containing protein [Streptomyces sp. YSPA8]